MSRRPLAAVLVAAACTLAAACGSNGRDLRPPVEGAVSPTRSTNTSVAPPTTAAPTMSLTSSAFVTGGEIPAEDACDGPSPALSWSGVPAGVTELALVVVDPQAEGEVLWLVTGIKPTNAALPKGQVPVGAQQHENSAGKVGWSGPCPPAGETHTYNFLLLGLSQPSAVAPGTPVKDAVAALQAKARGQVAQLAGTYTGTGATAGTGPVGTAGGTTPGAAGSTPGSVATTR